MNPEELTGDGNYGSLIGTYLGLSSPVPVVRVEKIGSQVSVEDVDSVFWARSSSRNPARGGGGSARSRRLTPRPET